jgi:predicted ATP-dependent Lon-type protease
MKIYGTSYKFYDVHFSYIDIETIEEKFVSVPEQGGGKIIKVEEFANVLQVCFDSGAKKF